MRNRPVFILAPLNRSGTNFLADILKIFPEFELPKIAEDYVLEHSDKILEYFNLTWHRYERRFPNNNAEDFLPHAGIGLESFLRSSCDRKNSRILSKTPRAYGINNFFKLFPDSKLVIILRDGRDTVESAAKSFTYASHEYWMQQWKEGARLVLNFMYDIGENTQGKKWYLVHFEDLILNPEKVLPGLFNFLDCSEDLFDWAKFNNLPLRGSSLHHGTKTGLHWEPVKKPDNFNPLKKWENWDKKRKNQFKRIAGAELIELKYEKDNNW